MVTAQELDAIDAKDALISSQLCEPGYRQGTEGDFVDI